MEVLTVGALTSLVLEGIKWVVALTTKKVPTFTMPTLFYVVVIPVLNYLMGFVLAWLGVQADMPMFDVKQLIIIALASLVSLGTYTIAIKPLKDYSKKAGI